jgi:hypothetical protein
MQKPCTDGFPLYNQPGAPGWNVYMAQTTTALAASPRWTQVAATSSAVHYGDICTNGLVCGSSDRSLLDFLSIGVDCNGFAHLAFAGNTPAEETADFQSGAANIHEVNQVKGSALTPTAACSASP